MADAAPERPPHPSFGEAFGYWLKLGLISFGGPAGQISIMHQGLEDRQSLAPQQQVAVITSM